MSILVLLKKTGLMLINLPFSDIVILESYQKVFITHSCHNIIKVLISFHKTT